MHRRRPIHRLLAGDLPAAAEVRLRVHLRGCGRCREVYAEERALLRALAGDPGAPTAAEEGRLVDRALAAATGPTAPEAQPARERRLASLVDRLLWLPAPALAGGALAVVAVVGIAVAAAWPSASPVVARIARGSAITVDGRGVSPRGGPVPLHRGDRVVAGPKGLAVLDLVRPGEVRVFPSTTLVVGAGGRVVDLSAGRVWCRIPEGHGGFVVRTPEAVVKDLGTSFVVDRQGKRTHVGVMSGTVEVRGRHRRRMVRLTAHEGTRVRAGDDPAPPSRYDPHRDRIDWAALWHRFVDSLKDALEKVRKLFR